MDDFFSVLAIYPKYISDQSLETFSGANEAFFFQILLSETVFIQQFFPVIKLTKIRFDDNYKKTKNKCLIESTSVIRLVAPKNENDLRELYALHKSSAKAVKHLKSDLKKLFQKQKITTESELLFFYDVDGQTIPCSNELFSALQDAPGMIPNSVLDYDNTKTNNSEYPDLCILVEITQNYGFYSQVNLTAQRGIQPLSLCDALFFLTATPDFKLIKEHLYQNKKFPVSLIEEQMIKISDSGEKKIDNFFLVLLGDNLLKNNDPNGDFKNYWICFMKKYRETFVPKKQIGQEEKESPVAKKGMLLLPSNKKARDFSSRMGKMVDFSFVYKNEEKFQQSKEDDFETNKETVVYDPTRDNFQVTVQVASVFGKATVGVNLYDHFFLHFSLENFKPKHTHYNSSEQFNGEYQSNEYATVFTPLRQAIGRLTRTKGKDRNRIILCPHKGPFESFNIGPPLFKYMISLSHRVYCIKIPVYEKLNFSFLNGKKNKLRRDFLKNIILDYGDWPDFPENMHLKDEDLMKPLALYNISLLEGLEKNDYWLDVMKKSRSIFIKELFLIIPVLIAVQFIITFSTDDPETSLKGFKTYKTRNFSFLECFYNPFQPSYNFLLNSKCWKWENKNDLILFILKGVSTTIDTINFEKRDKIEEECKNFLIKNEEYQLRV